MINETELIKLIQSADESPTLDYKQDLLLTEDGDKAEFVKDVIALANSGTIAHLIVGVEDGTGRPKGISTSHTAEQINQILKDKCDPPISIEYAQRNILGYEIGVIEINGNNSPYIVSVPDKFGGKFSSNPNKSFHIQRGTVYVRSYNITQGARRADLDTMYDRIKYVSLQADIKLNHKVNISPSNGFKKVVISFELENNGEVVATDIYVWMQFKNAKEIVKCGTGWSNITSINQDEPTVQLLFREPVIRPVGMSCGEVTIKVAENAKQIKARMIIGAINMRTKEGDYVISLIG